MGRSVGPRQLIGIDPGHNGAIVTWWRDDSDQPWKLERIFRLSSSEKEIAQFVNDLASATIHVACYMEKVHGWGEARSFNFGMYYGFVRGCLLANSIEVQDVAPQVWMKQMCVPPQKGEKAKHREAMRNLAQWFLDEAKEELSATNWNAAAILISCYGLEQVKVKEDEN